MAKTYQASNFSGQQLDDFMGKLLSKNFAGNGLALDEQGVLHNKAPGYGNLVYSYTHSAHKEVHPEGVNLATGEFTATAHGLSANQQVFIAVHAPYNLITPYNYLPGGLQLGKVGPGTYGKSEIVYYYVGVVDENTFTLSASSGGAAVTFTEVSTMDLSKFHIETSGRADLQIKNLPSCTELLMVINGRLENKFRFCNPGGASDPSGKIGFISYDSYTSVESTGNLGLGACSSWGSFYATIEMRFIGERHVLVTVTQDTLAHNSDNYASAYHVRQYMHRYMNRDDFTSVTLQQSGGFFNGTTVEVYTK